MNLKKIIATCTLGVMVAGSVAVPTTVEAASASISINNVVFSKPGVPSPQNINNRVYVPLRLVSEGMGNDVEWDNDTRSVLINTDLSAVQGVSSSVQIYVNGTKLNTSTSTGMPYITQSGYTMVPVRVVSENLGADVEWNQNSQTVMISTSTNNGSNENGNTQSGKPQSADEVTLQGASYSSLEQMQRYLTNKEVELRQKCAVNGTTFVPFPTNIAEYYYTIGQKYNIRGDVALAQALLETGYFQYGNEVKPWQNNYFGLGAIGHATTEEEMESQYFSSVNHQRAYLQVGIHGWCYDSVATGVEAHIQHMYSYATTAALPAGCELVDGRFAHGNRGTATYLTDLNGKWAVPGNGYGENIYNNMLVQIMNS